MPRLRRRQLIPAVLVVALAAAVAYEALRERPRRAAPVASPRPEHANEIARLEGGFHWATSRLGENVFDLEASSLLGIEGGLHFLDRVSDLRVYLEDGRAVRIRARRGQLVRDAHDEAHVVVLTEDVEVLDPDGTELVTEELVYDARAGTLTAPTQARVRGRGLDAVFGSLVYKPDARVVEAAGQIEIRRQDASTWTIEATRADYRLSTGELIFRKPLRATRADQALLAGPSTMQMARNGDVGSFEATAPVLLRGGVGRSAWQLAAAGAEVTGLVEGSQEPDAVNFGAPASFVYQDPGEDGALSARLHTSWLRLNPDEGRWRLVAGPGFEVGWTQTGDEASTGSLRGLFLELLRDAQGRVTSVEGREEIRLALEDGTEAAAARVNWRADDPGRVLLTGAPAQAWRGLDRVEAPRLVFLREDRVLVGEGDPAEGEDARGVLTEIASMSQGERSLFSGDEAVRVSCERVFLPQRGDQIIFEGPVQAWQGSTILRAARMRLTQSDQRLVAEERVSVRLVIAPGTPNQRTVRVLGDRLDYDGISRTARIEGQARFERPGTRVEADEMEIEREEGESGLRRLEAQGSVRLAFDAESLEGSGERLIWEGGERGTVLLIGGEQELARLQIPGKVVDAARIRYDLVSRAVTTEAGGGRSVLEEKRTPATDEDGAPEREQR